MISLNWDGMSGQIGALMAAYEDLPRHIAKKHLKAAMKRALKPGVPLLKKTVPKQKTRVVLGRDKSSGEYTARKVKGGGLRRSVKTISRYKGRNKDGSVLGVLGYEFGRESLKGLRLENGTKYIKPREYVKRTMDAIKNPTAALLIDEMKKALEAAARDKAPGVAQGYRRK